MYNISYNPEKFGLEIVASIEYSSRDYCFDTRLVFRQNNTGTLFTARDSGCSCPTPFESIGLDELEPFDLNTILAEVEAEHSKKWYAGDPPEDFIKTIKSLVVPGVDDRQKREVEDMKRYLSLLRILTGDFLTNVRYGLTDRELLNEYIRFLERS